MEPLRGIGNYTYLYNHVQDLQSLTTSHSLSRSYDRLHPVCLVVEAVGGLYNRRR